MQFKPYYITASQLDNLSIVAGQLIITTDTHNIYFDETNNSRIQLINNSGNSIKYITLTNEASATAITASISNFVLEDGTMLLINFANGVSYSNLSEIKTLNINNTGAVPISGILPSSAPAFLIYENYIENENTITHWRVINSSATNAQYADLRGTFSIATSDWISDTTTYDGYTVKTNITINGVSASDIPNVYFDNNTIAIAETANIAIVDSDTNMITLYAKSIPSATVTGAYIISKIIPTAMTYVIDGNDILY